MTSNARAADGDACVRSALLDDAARDDAEEDGSCVTRIRFIQRAGVCVGSAREQACWLAARAARPEAACCVVRKASDADVHTDASAGLQRDADGDLVLPRKRGTEGCLRLRQLAALACTRQP
jgi:hypothetical protein